MAAVSAKASVRMESSGVCLSAGRQVQGTGLGASLHNIRGRRQSCDRSCHDESSVTTSQT
jgi:hypothetical protein